MAVKLRGIHAHNGGIADKRSARRRGLGRGGRLGPWELVPAEFVGQIHEGAVLPPGSVGPWEATVQGAAGVVVGHHAVGAWLLRAVDPAVDGDRPRAQSVRAVAVARAKASGLSSMMLWPLSGTGTTATPAAVSSAAPGSGPSAAGKR